MKFYLSYFIPIYVSSTVVAQSVTTGPTVAQALMNQETICMRIKANDFIIQALLLYSEKRSSSSNSPIYKLPFRRIIDPGLEKDQFQMKKKPERTVIQPSVERDTDFLALTHFLTFSFFEMIRCFALIHRLLSLSYRHSLLALSKKKWSSMRPAKRILERIGITSPEQRSTWLTFIQDYLHRSLLLSPAPFSHHLCESLSESTYGLMLRLAE